NETNPKSLVGFDSLARLRIFAPDWPPAIVHGLAIAGIIAGLDKLLQFVSATWMWRGPAAAEGLDLLLPWALPLEKIGTGLFSVILTFFAVHFLARLVKRPWLAIVIVAVAIGLMSVHPALRPWPLSIEPGVVVGLLTWTVWEFGFLAAVIAFWASEVFDSGTAMLAAGGGPYLIAGIVCFAGLAALPVL